MQNTSKPDPANDSAEPTEPKPQRWPLVTSPPRFGRSRSPDSQQQRLRRAGDEPVALAELRAGELPGRRSQRARGNGYTIERVHDHGRLVGVRLLEPRPPDANPATPRQRWP
jgi:hypothetical protein